MHMKTFRSYLLAGTAIVLLVATGYSVAQDATPPVRPRITGISHVGYFVSDLPKALNFWHDFLGFDESYDLKKKNSEDVRIAFIKINDHQHIELFNEPPTSPPNMMSHLCFTVDDIEAMRTYLRSKGFEVKPGNGGKTRTGVYAFEIKDPDRMLVEFIQSLPTGVEAQAKGRFEPATRISDKNRSANLQVVEGLRRDRARWSAACTHSCKGPCCPQYSVSFYGIDAFTS